MRAFRSALLVLGLSWLTATRAQEVEPERREPVPDLDFLEYLGTWAEDDDEWIAIEEWRKDNAADTEEPKDPKDAKESDTERDDDDESK